MDEAEKYKQRLEAIAEKRRLQEEQDKARREMEDEKLRVQQLKRKSLRDQWLMEGAPLSPTSLDAHSPRLPLWGNQALEMEKHIDKLQSESQRLAEEREKLEEQTADGQTEAIKVADAAADMVRDVVQNGENKTRSETREGEVKVNQNPLLDKTAVILTNGVEALKANADHTASEQNNQSTTNGPTQDTEAVVSRNLSPELCVSEAEPGQLPNVNVDDEEEEEGTLVMRAECVIITDEGDDVPEELPSQEIQQESTQADKTPPTNPEAGEEGEETVDEVVKSETAPETFSESEKSEATELTTEAQPATRDGDREACIQVSENGAEETKAEGLAQELEDPASVQVQSPADALEGTTVAPVPVYSEAQPSIVSPELEAEGKASTAPEGAEVALKAHDPACLPGQFQEIPLADSQENQRREAGPGEQEPLLLNAKDPNNKTEPAGANSPASTERQNPTRASQGEETEAPKHKSCQCCSVM
ncbi:paralemmin-3 [Stegastes partitus]|uniref:Paralemmin-3 n=1 Tax=Stegastes partitus TaxID=144197 RepID=A0A9Y4JG59_9TELE|nr:PREDICTED: paralemmin-3 [Stegastes partitus]XP_008274827.1 PREDICTED: paralemmin-3 [Stegastes partitus]XP_008274835.1 PREDICTED: paralemmin-3 [Stegastes partitus]XP_008274843.1 PREDICTED: paralemmin-3 [Stegastes partitus]XP_008274851.1 PREDICTED: paralemmin-3 [Stegastes partitus]XP_008274859.1 PREDICTED: paralemmin-3 [Stegastes partitus]